MGVGVELDPCSTGGRVNVVLTVPTYTHYTGSTVGPLNNRHSGVVISFTAERLSTIQR